MRITQLVLLSAVSALMVACSGNQPPPAAPAAVAPPLEAIATTKQIMLEITIPESDVVFKVGDTPPADDAGWDKVRNAAMTLAESGNLLLIGSRVVDHEDWTKIAQALIDTSKLVAKAAEAKNVDQVLDAGNQVYETCDGCHKKYMATRGAK